MRKYIPILLNTITWAVVLFHMVVLPKNFRPNMMYNLISGAVIIFACLSFGVSILNGLIAGCCMKEAKDIRIPALIHGIFTAIIAFYAISFLKEPNLEDFFLYPFIYLLIGGLTGCVMVGEVFLLKVLREYISKIISRIKGRKKKEPLYQSGYPPHDF
ncbi:MAG: hypothetical protein LUG98_11380 [Tannerellaceae bacterium]|nr:hypothetical protein [Tannerellaceae bacterium]